jgi:hypothetical protein
MIFSDDTTESVLFYSVVPDYKGDPGQISVLQPGNQWVDLNPDMAGQDPGARTVLATLANQLKRVEVKHVSIKELKEMPGTRPPEDDVLMALWHDAIEHKITVTTAVTAAELIRPYSHDFCLRCPEGIIAPTRDRILQGHRPAMAVYWDGKSFVMSDDYPAYIAYRQCDISEVHVAILGEFPSDKVTVLRSGERELLPPIVIQSHAEPAAPSSPEFEAWQLQEKLRKKREMPIDLMLTWISFAELLADEDLDEKHLHDFLKEHPEALNAYAIDLQSEVRLGADYRIDLVLRTNGLHDEVQLIELEHHRHPIFTQSGQPRAEITHAVQQVNDWIHWLREHPSETAAVALGSVPKKGMVIAGRSRQLTDEQRTRLAHLNADNPVPVITYDELLERFENMILRQIEDQ